MTEIRFEDSQAWPQKLEEDENLLLAVCQAAENLVDAWDRGPFGIQEVDRMTPQARALVEAVLALRSHDEDRGLRDPGSPGEQEAGSEQAHEPDPHS